VHDYCTPLVTCVFDACWVDESFTCFFKFFWLFWLSQFDIKLVFNFMKCFSFGHMQVVLVFLVQAFDTSVDQCCGSKKTYCFCLWCAHHLLILLSFRLFVSIVECVRCTLSFLISMLMLVLLCVLFKVLVLIHSQLFCFVSTQGVGPCLYFLIKLLLSYFILFLSKLLG
jgi:hypothetical protein